jgi:DNA repair ATPase RecN
VGVGATWRRVDLHLHTPGVHSFAHPAGMDARQDADRLHLVDQYVERLVAAGIDVAAITDYQGVREPWYRPIRDRAAERGITVLPGAEISVEQGGGRGLHILLVGDPGARPDDINDAIRFLGRQPHPLFRDREQHLDLDLRSSLVDALRLLRRQLRCAIILPHVWEKNGMLKELGAKQTAQFIGEGLVDAIDHCEDAVPNLQGTGILPAKRLDSVACTLSSDPKTLDEIGTKRMPDGRLRATWIKLSTVDATALRLALHDPQTRVLTRRPEPPRHPRILSMEVEGVGFLGGLALRFNDDLTTLIGGRGTGKSAILETVRYALDGPVYSDQSERLSLIRYALGSGGRVRLLIERPGQQQQGYEVTRVLDQQPRVTDLTTGTALEVPPMGLFGAGGSPVILLQREIQAVARDDAFRRRLLDEIIGDEARQADLAVRRTVEELRRNHRAIEDVESQLAKRDEYVERLNRLAAEISFYEGQGVADKLDRHAKIGADQARLETALGHVADALAAHDQLMSDVVDTLAAAGAGLRGGQSEHGDELRELARAVDATCDRVHSVVADMHADLGGLHRDLTAALADWPARMAGLEADLHRLQADLGAGRLDAQRYVDAIAQRTALHPIVDRMVQHEAELRRLRSARIDLLRRLQDQRRHAFRLRQKAAAEVNDKLAGKLRMEVTYLGDTADFATRLSTLLRGSRVSADAIDDIVSSPGVDGVELARYTALSVEALATQLGITESMAQRLHNWLILDPGRLRQVELLAPDDRVSIALVIDHQPRDLAVLSSGQKATALLLLCFAQGGRPLILDQPEDDLDNRFVYEDVVSLLRLEKGVADPDHRRQIIAATHNANIPVNGDAELVLSLADGGGRCVVRARGSIDDATIREEIRTVLEGGADAFRRRAEKYGGLDDA